VFYFNMACHVSFYASTDHNQSENQNLKCL